MALFSNNNGIFSPSGKQIIPSVTSADAGKVLTVGDNGAWGAATAPDPLPEVTSADAGKVLTVSDAGAWEAAAASGGGYPVFEFNIDPGSSSGTITPGEGVTVSKILDALANGPAIAKLIRNNDWFSYLFITRSPTIAQVVIEVYRMQMIISNVNYEYMYRFTGSGQNSWYCDIIGRYEFAKI